MLCDASLVLSLSGLLHFALFATSAVAANVTWISPLQGDAYGSGDTIVGQWDAEKPVVSPSFRLCVLTGGGTNKRAAASGGSCGTAVWPTVQQSQSDGSYVIHMTLPNVTTTSQCYLEMKDDFGETSASPAFSYQPSVDDDTDPTDVHAMEAQPSAEDASTPTPAPSSPPSSPSSVPQPSTSSQQAPSLEESRIPTPTAAYAVPLSFVGSVLLCAGGLAFQQRRRLRAERRAEHDALQARQTLSRQPTLDLVGLGFTNLGRGPAPGRSPAASASLQRQDSVRSTSVSRMRAWRREVSQHHLHRPHSHHADDETYVARSDDGRSVASSRSGHAGAYLHRPAQPRRPTREPFYVGRSQARRTTVPAGLYRESPIGLPHPRDGGRESRYATYGRRRYIAEEEEDWGRLKRRDDRRRPLASEDVDRIKVESYHNANINDDVFSHYLDLSPIPLSPAQTSRSPPRDPSSVSRPERLHVRRYAQDATHNSARPRVEERDLYTVVARKISRDDFV